MATYDDYTSFDATDLAELVRRKEVKPVELVESAIDSIERLNPLINAVVTPMYELALKAASGPLGGAPFAGVPFLLKDVLAEYAGVRFTEGTAFLRDYVSKEDSELVARYKRAGLLIVGKTNTPELAIGVNHRAAPLWTNSQPVGYNTHSGRFQRRFRSSCGNANDSNGSRQRRRGLYTRSGFLLRSVWSQAYTWSKSVGSALRRSLQWFGSGTCADPALYGTALPCWTLLQDLRSGHPTASRPPRGPSCKRSELSRGNSGLPSQARRHWALFSIRDCSAALREAVSLCDSCGHEMVEKSPDLNWELLWQTFTTVLATGFAWAVADWGPKNRTQACRGALRTFRLGLYRARASAQWHGLSAGGARPAAVCT